MEEFVMEMENSRTPAEDVESFQYTVVSSCLPAAILNHYINNVVGTEI